MTHRGSFIFERLAFWCGRAPPLGWEPAVLLAFRWGSLSSSLSEADESIGQVNETSGDVDFESMTVAQLKVLLKEAGKPVSGKKAELISRLTE